MNTAESHALRSEMQRFITTHWSLDLTVREWWARLADAHLSTPAWPAPFGRGLSASLTRLVSEELAAAEVIGPPLGGVGMRLAGPTLLVHGTEELRAAYLPALVRGEESWCQLFSEPGAGSDLPSLATRAVRDGDGWRVSGQKVWSSAADVARRGLLLARSNTEVPKRQGITCFVLDMDQPGVEVRPLRTMNGTAPFCEVFLTDARVLDTEVVGEIDRGWDVARTALTFERGSATERPARGMVTVPSGECAGYLDRVVGDVIASRVIPESRIAGSAIPVRMMIDLARERGLTNDPVLSDRLVRYFVMTEVHRRNAQRARDQSWPGGSASAYGSLSKLALAEICSVSRDLAFAVLGASALLWGPDAALGGAVHLTGLSSPGVRIGAGTDEVQRNILAERALGLPRDPA